MPHKIPISRACIGELDQAYVQHAVQHSWNDDFYEYIDRFEREFAAWCGTQHAVATSSATGALHIVLQALGVGPGDEVIMADSNWIATAAPVVQLGARPIFVDINPQDFCIDPQAARRAMTTRTRAVIATHLYGYVCDMESLLDLGVPVIEDCAEALGSQWRSKPVGCLAHAGVFSFHHSKTMTAGEGGILVCNDKDLYDRCWQISNHGRARGQQRRMWAEAVGMKYKMSNLQAALACAQLEQLPGFLECRQMVWQIYAKAFRYLNGVTLPEPRESTINGAWMPVVIFDTQDQNHMAQRLFQQQGIEVREFFPPLSSMPMFDTVINANSQLMHERALCLPSYSDIKMSDLLTVIDAVRQAAGSQGLVDLEQ